MRFLLGFTLIAAGLTLGCNTPGGVDRPLFSTNTATANELTPTVNDGGSGASDLSSVPVRSEQITYEISDSRDAVFAALIDKDGTTADSLEEATPPERTAFVAPTLVSSTEEDSHPDDSTLAYQNATTEPEAQENASAQDDPNQITRLTWIDEADTNFGEPSDSARVVLTSLTQEISDHETSVERSWDAADSGAITSEIIPEALAEDHEQVVVESNGRPYQDISLHDAIRTALEHSTVLSDIGGRLLQSASSVASVHDPTLQATDPRFGVEGALSEFDAQLRARAFFEKNDQVLNNEILGGGVNQFRQDLWRFQAELSKKAATGTQFAVRHNVADDLNNANRNLFPRAFDWNSEVEVRHPLLQGGGVRFNRISGRSLTPGVANGIAIAQVNSKMSIVDFQVALRDYLSNVENAYWDLVLAYRTLDAKKAARDRTLATWQILKNLSDQGVVNRDKVDQALEQYFRQKEDVENAFYGRPSGGTRAFNGNSGGALQSETGVLVAERRLRLMMGTPMDAEVILRPETDPPIANILYELQAATQKAIENRGELELQRLRLAKDGMQLESDRNYLLPQLDMVARYRLRGLGDNLYDARVPDTTAGFESISSNRHEWMVGAEVSYPLGFRQGHTAVRNSQLRLARERAIMARMQRHLSHDVGNALSNKERAYRVLVAARNRWEAANRRYEYLTDEDVQAAKKMDFTLILDADRKLADAEVAYHRATVDYALALKNIHFEMGTLFGYCDVQLAPACL